MTLHLPDGLHEQVGGGQREVPGDVDRTILRESMTDTLEKVVAGLSFTLAIFGASAARIAIKSFHTWATVTPGAPLGLSRFAGWVWFGELSGTNTIVMKMRVKNTTNIDMVASP